jgi:hypothetical protein
MTVILPSAQAANGAADDEHTEVIVHVQWASPTQGVLAQSVGQIMVDAVTGEILPGSPTAQESPSRKLRASRKV